VAVLPKPCLAGFWNGYVRSEPSAEAQHRPMLDHVEFVASPALTLCIIDGERPVADHARERDAVVGAELEAVGADGLPGEVAPDAEPADVAAQEEFVSRRHRIAHPCTDDGIEPVDRSGSGERSGSTDLEVADVDRTRDVEREVRLLVPVARAGKDVEGQWSLAGHLVGGTHLDDGHLDIEIE
jgi:hypothetical protein